MIPRRINEQSNNFTRIYMPTTVPTNSDEDDSSISSMTFTAINNEHSYCDRCQNCLPVFILKSIVLSFTFLISTVYMIRVFFAENIDKNVHIIVAFLYAFVVLNICKRLKLCERIISPVVIKVLDIFQETIYRDVLNAIISICIAGFIVYMCFMDMKRTYALGSMIFLIFTSFLLNFRNYSKIQWNIIVRSLNLQFVLALLLYYMPCGRQLMMYMGNGTVSYLNFSKVGATFVYGSILMEQFVFAFYVLSSIYLSYVTIAILRHIGAIKYMIRFSNNLSFLTGISSVEGIYGIMNIFLSMTETCVVVRCNLENLTNSELFSLMVTGLSTISFSAFFGYVSLGANINYLLISSIIAIPCSFAFSKIFVPGSTNDDIILGEITIAHETRPLNRNTQLRYEDKTIETVETANEENENKNILDKCIESIIEASFSIQIILGTLIVVISFIAFLDKFIEILVSPFNSDTGLFKITSSLIAYAVPAIGVDVNDAEIIAEMFVRKVLVNEYVAFEILGKNLKNFTNERSIAVANFIVCGFGNISSAGMLSSTIGKLTNFRVNTSSILIKSICVACIVNIYCACTISILVN